MRRSHASKRAALRILDTLMRHGGRATTLQLGRPYWRCAAHSDVHSLREWLRGEHGYGHDDALDAVKATSLGLNDSGQHVYLYELRDDVKELHRRLRAEGREMDEPPPSLTTGSSAPAAPAHQEPLFDTSHLFKD